MNKYKVSIPGMHCMMCVNKITNHMMELDEVEDVEVDLETKKATITAEEPLSEDLIKNIINKAGYEIKSIEEI